MHTLKASLVCGLLAACFAVLLCHLGAFAPLNLLLWGTRSSALLPQAAGAIVLGIVLAWTTIDIRQPVLQGVVVAVGMVETIAMTWVLHVLGVVWLPITTLTAGGLATGFALIFSHSSLSHRKRLIEGLLDGKISKRTFRSLMESGKPLNVSGERLEVSIVVCNLFNRQSLAETLPPADYLELVNAFLRTGTDALKAAGGTLDSHDGEALRAVFGAPMAEEAHATQACDAAWALRRELDAFCHDCEERWKVTLEYGIGVNSDEVIAGIRGAGRLASFSVEGERLEFSRRLSSANAFYGSRILLGPETFRLAHQSVEVRPVELIRFSGKPAPVEIYELLGPKNTLSPEAFALRDLFWKGVILFRQCRWDDAARHFQQAMPDSGSDDAPVRFYLQRVAQMRAGQQNAGSAALPKSLLSL